METENIVRMKRVVNRLTREAGMTYRLPLPVWDNSGSLVGVAIEQDKHMGQTGECLGQATFTLSPKEYASEATIAAKASLAISALRSEVLVSIRPKVKQQHAG